MMLEVEHSPTQKENGSGLAIYNPIITLEDTTDDIIALIRW